MDAGAGAGAALPLTKYERARLVSTRVRELEENAAPVVEAGPEETPLSIALREVDERLLSLRFRRLLPGGRWVELSLQDLPPDA